MCAIESGFGFTATLFNLEPVPGNALNEAISVFIQYTNTDGSSGSITQAIDTNGQNFLGIADTNGEIFTRAGFLANPNTTGIGALKQLRLGGVAAIGAVSEPATWMLFILRLFTGSGVMRRSRRKESINITYA